MYLSSVLFKEEVIDAGVNTPTAKRIKAFHFLTTSVMSLCRYVFSFTGQTNWMNGSAPEMSIVQTSSGVAKDDKLAPLFNARDFSNNLPKDRMPIFDACVDEVASSFYGIYISA